MFKNLVQERADLVREQKALFEGGELTAEQKQRDDAIHARLVAIDDQLKRVERQREAERTAPGATAGAGRITDLAPRAEADPWRGFADAADFALAVRAAATPGARFDERLLMAAPTNFHRETGSDEGYMVPPALREGVFEAITAGDGNLLDLVDAEPTASNSVSVIRDESTPWGASGVQAAWRAEGAQMTPSRLATALDQVQLHELYAFVLATEDLLADAPRMADRLTRKAGLAIRYRINEAIVNGSGVGQPMGWFTSTGKVSVAKETSQTAATIVAANVAKMYARSLNPSAGYWFVAPDAMPQLVTLTLGNQPIWVAPNAGLQNAPGGLLMGRPVIVLDNCQTLGTQGDIQFVVPKGYLAATKGLLPQYAESTHLYFDYGIRAFRWTFRLGGQPYLSAPVSPAKGASTRSHTVVLDTRA